MRLNWKTIEDKTPVHKSGFNPPFIICLVFAYNPERPQGGSIDICRWDVEGECWYEADIRSNWILQSPYVITHYADDVEGPDIEPIYG